MADESQWTEVDLWAEIHRLRAAVKGPEGYSSWQEAATAERIRRVKAERALALHPSAGQQAEPTELVARIRSAIRGHETWRVMNAAEDGFCMEFASPEYLNPERACKNWLNEQNPEWLARNGYHAVKSFEYTGAERLALEAADALAGQQAEPAGEIVLFGGYKEISWRNGQMPDVGTKLYARNPSERPAPAGLAVGEQALIDLIKRRFPDRANQADYFAAEFFGHPKTAHGEWLASQAEQAEGKGEA